ncbi:FAD-binding protein [Streptomyces sp. Tue6028]|uniref:FAD-binding protein n=1 Tax=Streptomyces sp. Tue6028 TaxID=2036037 RepID=UPI003D73F088
MIERRDVLRAGVLGGVAGTLGLQAPDSAAAAAEAAGPVGARDWKRLADALSPGATLYRPHGSEYESLALPFNHRYAGIRPAGIVACATTEDVSAAIRWARSVGLPAVPRTGLGHNYAGFSTTTGLLLNMARMKSIVSTPVPGGARSRVYGPMKVVHDAGTVTVGAVSPMATCTRCWRTTACSCRPVVAPASGSRGWCSAAVSASATRCSG